MRFKKIFRIITASCVVSLMAALLPITGVMAVGVLTLTPASGPVGTLVYASGTGFAPTTSITVISNTLLLQGAATTSSAGVLPSTLLGAVPTVARGTYVLTASDGATAIFTVVPQILLAATTGFVGDTVTINGNGFAASSAVNIFWDGGSTPIATGYTGTTGVLMATPTSTTPGMTFIVPDGIRGQHQVIAQDVSLQTISALFTVNSKLTINPTSGGVGDIISIVGTGFANGAVQISFDSTQNANTITTTNGRFATTLQVPPASRGSHVILAQDGSGSASANFSLGQKITLNPTTAGVGDTIAISGNGFAPNSPITYKLDGNTLVISSPAVQSQANGNLPDVAFTVPAVAAGTHTVTVTDGAQNAATATFSLLAKVAITPPSGTVGTQIAITGSGFTPNAPVAISWDNAALTPAVNITASATGTISVTITAPAGARGNHVIKASDTSGNAVSATFAISPKISLSPTTGGYGDTITVTFTGFTATSNITEVKIYSGSASYILATVPPSPQTDAAGSATLKFAVPALPNGTWTIQATDAGGASFSTNLTVTQKIVLNKTSGSAGDLVAVTGTGFKAGAGIDLKYNGVTIVLATVTTTDANGSFTTQFAVPKTIAGALSVSASDGTNTATASFTATANATISKTTNQTTPGFVGMDLTVTGTGYLPNAVITVTFESAPVTVAIVQSDSSGSFTASFKVPTAPSGPHTIHASDGTTTKDFSFFMDSTAPVAAALALPTDKFKPKQPIPFTWGAVTDPSGVTYTLQISQDPSFGTLILEKTGLTNAGYTMTTAEKLKSAGSKTPYYWRVRATDLAGNVGAWSTANTFTIGFMWPSWIIHVWYGIAIVIALLLGLWIGRRMAYQSY